MELLAARQAELDLGPAVLEIEAERNERQTALADLAAEPRDLPFMKEELPVPFGVVVGVRPMAVGIDMAPEEPALPVPDRRIAVLEADLAFTKRLDLGAAEYQPGLDRLEDLVLVPRPAVGANRPVAVALDLTGPPCWVL